MNQSQERVPFPWFSSQFLNVRRFAVHVKMDEIEAMCLNDLGWVGVHLLEQPMKRVPHPLRFSKGGNNDTIPLEVLVSRLGRNGSYVLAFSARAGTTKACTTILIPAGRIAPARSSAALYHLPVAPEAA